MIGPLSAPAGQPHLHGGGVSLDAVLLFFAAIAVVVYAAGVVASRRRGRAWPARRIVFWCAGIALVLASATGPLVAASHGDFVLHMWTHLLGGMLAPLLLVLSAPVTLALRTLAVTPARRLSRVLRSVPARVVAHPVVAGSLSAGGLWVIYLSPLYAAMQSSALVHLLVLAHLVVAGYLFASAVIGLDPRPHPPRRMLVAVVLLLAVASHAMLARYLYAHPPEGVPLARARDGARLMYYAGAYIEAAVIVIFCARWYRSAGRRFARSEPRPILDSVR